MLLPCTDNLLRNITLDRPSYRVGRFDSLPYDIERALLDIGAGNGHLIGVPGAPDRGPWST